MLFAICVRCSSIIGGRTFFTISRIAHHGSIRHGLSIILVGYILQGKLCSSSCGNERKIWIFPKQLSVDKSKPILKLDLILLLATLNMQANLFKLTMQSSATTMLQKPFSNQSNITRMWQIDNNSLVVPNCQNSENLQKWKLLWFWDLY
jgi:hypothetical protein